MAEDPPVTPQSTVQANRTRMQGGGVGQREMDMQQDPNRDTYATNPQRTEPYGDDPKGGGDDLGADNGRNAMGTGNSVGGEDRSFAGGDEAGEDDAEDDESGRRDAMGLDPNLGRDEAGIQNIGDLGAGTPANVDIHNLGQSDNPEQEWGEGEPGAMHGQTNTRRPDPTEAQRGQGAKTRQLNKDIISRRT